MIENRQLSKPKSDGPEVYLAAVKNNVGKMGQTLVFIAEEGRLFFEGTSSLTADELVDQNDVSDVRPRKVKEVEQMLRNYFSKRESIPSTDAEAFFNSKGYSTRTLKRAKANLGVGRQKRTLFRVAQERTENKEESGKEGGWIVMTGKMSGKRLQFDRSVGILWILFFGGIVKRMKNTYNEIQMDMPSAGGKPFKGETVCTMTRLFTIRARPSKKGDGSHRVTIHAAQKMVSLFCNGIDSCRRKERRAEIEQKRTQENIVPYREEL